jgi:hypothetical protein
MSTEIRIRAAQCQDLLNKATRKVKEIKALIEKRRQLEEIAQKGIDECEAAMRELLQRLNMYTATDRCPAAFARQNCTFVTAAAATVVDYVVVDSATFAAGCVGGVHDGAVWELADSPHRAVWATLPLYAPPHARAPRPKPFLKWRVDVFLDKSKERKAAEEYQDALELALDAAQPGLAAAAGDVHAMGVAQVNVHRRLHSRPQPRLTA